MKIEKNVKDQMTPIERKKAIQNGERADRVMAMPFTSEFKCYLSGISVRDFWFDVKKWHRQRELYLIVTAMTEL